MIRPRLFFLAHRIPYPPDKGEKIRAWHMLEHLARDWTVDLGCLMDDPADAQHLPVLRDCCAEVHAAPVRRSGRIARTLFGTRPGQPLSLAWFHEPGLARWVGACLGTRRYEAVLVYSSAMAAYVPPGPGGPLRILDMVDVDSEKWRAYAASAGGAKRLVWAREARTLLAFERRVAAQFDRTLLVSAQEAQTFAALAPEVAPRIDWVDNGVDVARFDPACDWPDPFATGRPAIVFTGTMDYRPNVEAVSFFATEVTDWRRRYENGAPIRHLPCGRWPSCRACMSRVACPICGPTWLMRRWRWHRCASRAASRTRCWRRWPWGAP
jgi:sugar transferase (PEP-CTERM/EpsH1 system associated)